MDISRGLMTDTGNPATFAQTTLYAAGDLGKFFEFPQESAAQSVASNKSRKIFQLVKITSVTGFTSGCGLYWSDETNYEVTTAVTNSGRAAGIGVNSSAPSANQYILMQVRGPVKFNVKGTPTAACLANGTTVLVADAAGTVNSVTAAQNSNAVFGYTTAASAGGALVAGQLTVPISE